MREKLLSIYGLTILLGVCTGCVGSFFQLLIHYLTLFLREIHGTSLLIAAISSAALVLLAWFMVVYWAPEAAGSGVQEIEGSLLHLRPIAWRRLLPVKFIGGVFVISAQMVVGREGPTIQMGGNFGDMFGELFKLARSRRDALIAAGAAAGLATAFNAPIAGVLFVIEEMRSQFNFTFTHFKMVAICCMAATMTTEFIVGPMPAIPMFVFDAPALSSLWMFVLFGILMGFAGLIFNKLLMFSLKQTDKLSFKQKMIYVALVAMLIGALSLHFPALVGGGYWIIERSLSLSPGIGTLILIIIIRYVTTMLCYVCGIPGGIFAPMLALGTLLGLVSYDLLSLLITRVDVHPGMFAVAGMGALFSAAVRAPLTGIILVVEMTQNYSLILPLMVSCLTSTTIVQMAKNPPIYTQLLHRSLRNQAKLKANNNFSKM